MPDTLELATTPVQKVVIVNSNVDALGIFETVLDAGRYDMVFVESHERAYSQVKRVLPNLVILCARIDEVAAFQLLTMLKLDPDTRDIPLLTYTAEYEGQESASANSRSDEDGDSPRLVRRQAALRMN